MASGIMEVTTIDKKRTVVGDGFHFWVKIKALVNSDKMKEMARKVKDKSTVEDYKRIHAAYDKSQKDSERSDYIKAIEAFTSAIALDPTRCDAYGERAIDYQKIGELEKAKEDLDKSLTLQYSIESKGDAYYYAYYAIGKDYFEKKKYYDAIDPFNKAERFYDHWGVYQKSDPLYFWRGISYLRMNQFEKAIKDFNKALTIDPDNSSGNNQYIYENRGLAHYNNGDKSAARADFQKACNLGLSSSCQRVK